MRKWSDIPSETKYGALGELAADLLGITIGVLLAVYEPFGIWWWVKYPVMVLVGHEFIAAVPRWFVHRGMSDPSKL